MISRSHAPASPLLHGLAMAASAVPASLLFGYLGAAYVNGFDGLIIGLALLGGMILSAILITPALQGSGAGSLSDYVTRRFGRAAGLLFLSIQTISVILLAAAEFAIASRIIAAVTGISEIAVTAALAIAAGALVLLAASRAGPAVLCLLALALIASVAVAVWVVSGGAMLPHLSYGAALRDISGHETAMMDAGLADFRSLKAHARAFLELDALNTTALAVTLLAGAVILIPASKQRHLTARGSRLATVVSAIAAMGLLISIPVLASYAKREVYGAIVRGTPVTALPPWLEAPSRAGLVSIYGVSAKLIEDVTRAISADPAPDAAKVQAFLSGDPARAAMSQAFADAKPQVKTAVIEAAKLRAATLSASSWSLLQEAVLPQAATAANNKTGLLTHGAVTISPWAVPMIVAGTSPAPGLVAGLLISALAIAALATIRRLSVDESRALGTSRFAAVGPAASIIAFAVISRLTSTFDVMWWALTGLSLAAASLFPVLLAGAWSRRVSSQAAIAGMCIGAALALSYSVATRLFPVQTYQMAPSLSNASDGTKKKFESLKAVWQKAPEGNAKADAWFALQTYAVGNTTRPNMAEWWGVASSSSAILALPLALLVLLVVDLPRRILRRKSDAP